MRAILCARHDGFSDVVSLKLPSMLARSNAHLGAMQRRVEDG